MPELFFMYSWLFWGKVSFIGAVEAAWAKGSASSILCLTWTITNVMCVYCYSVRVLPGSV